jgi:hypothetical protein
MNMEVKLFKIIAEQEDPEERFIEESSLQMLEEARKEKVILEDFPIIFYE